MTSEGIVIDASRSANDEVIATFSVPSSAARPIVAASRPNRSISSGSTRRVMNASDTSASRAGSPSRLSQSSVISRGSGISPAGQPAIRICPTTRSGARSVTYWQNLALMLKPTTTNSPRPAASATASASAAIRSSV